MYLPSNFERRIEILRFVWNRQMAKQKTTKAEVIRHMRGMSAVNTTHGLILAMIKEGKLNVEELNSQVHFLTVTGKYDLSRFENESLIQAITEIHSIYKKVSGGDEGLVNLLKELISNYKLRLIVENYYKDLNGRDPDEAEFKKHVWKNAERKKRIYEEVFGKKKGKSKS